MMSDVVDERGLPMWPAAERNKQPILDELLRLLAISLLSGKRWLEISAGTGQHALHFAPHLQQFEYVVSDCDEQHLETLSHRVASSTTGNLVGPVCLDTCDDNWAVGELDVIYNANMVHIAPLAAALGLFRGAGRHLRTGGVLLTYGPYMVDGRHTSESNEEFHRSLKGRNPDWGIRDLDALGAMANEHGITLCEQLAMPANNFLLVWRKG